MEKKYAKLLKGMVGLSVNVMEENGLCHLVASGNATVSLLAGLQGAQRMEIKEVNDDYIVLQLTNGYIRTYSLHVIVLDMIPGK